MSKQHPARKSSVFHASLKGKKESLLRPSDPKFASHLKTQYSAFKELDSHTKEAISVIRDIQHEEKAASVEEWVAHFGEAARQSFVNIRTRKPQNPRTYVLRKEFACHFHRSGKPCIKTVNGSCSHKSRDCPAGLTVEIPVVAGSGATVKLSHCHNHEHFSCDVLKLLPVSAAVVLKLQDLFSKGYGPAAALDYYRAELYLENGEDFYVMMADRSVVPDQQFAYRLFRKSITAAYGEMDRDSTILKLREYIQSYNEAHKETLADIEVVGGDVFVARCTPLMRRVSTRIHQSAELLFVDSPGSLDGSGMRVFHLFTQSYAGGLPICMALSTTESLAGLTTLFGLVKRVLPKECFFGRGADNGPEVIMTDDSAPERMALASAWPLAARLLCTFHMLQAKYRFLRDAKNGVDSTDRKSLFYLFRRIVYSSDPSEADQLYGELMQSEAWQKQAPKICTIHGEAVGSA